MSGPAPFFLTNKGRFWDMAINDDDRKERSIKCTYGHALHLARR